MNSSIKRHHIDLQDEPVLPVSKRGTEILSDPLLNKGTGFPDSERDELSLKGLVPPQVVSIDDQVRRVMENYPRKLVIWSGIFILKRFMIEMKLFIIGYYWSTLMS